MKIASRYVVFLAITVFCGRTTAGDKVVVVPLIDDAASAHSTLFLQSNGQKIGVLVGMGDLNEGSYAEYQALSFNEYYFNVEQQSGLLDYQDIFFATSDCSGQAYLGMGDTYDLGPFAESQGRVFSSAPGYSVSTYYVPRGTSSAVMRVRSSWQGYSNPSSGECITIDEQKAFYPILPNDPAVTGVKDNYQLPINAGF
jgi:hypothetical protein